jgi:5'-3' exonuclease
MYHNMLIDARNAAYRAIYAGLTDSNFMAQQNDFSIIFFRFICSYVRRFKPSSVHFFWDSPKSEIWRKKIYPEYKDGREHSVKKEQFDIDLALEKLTNLIQELTPHLGCWSYLKDKQEADDLIYAFCKANLNQKTLIISSDKDFIQIPYMHHNVDCFNPMIKDNQMYRRTEEDPIDIKCFIGEKTDNIKGYFKVGPVTAGALTKDYNKRLKFLEERGWETYMLNRALVDLSLCPYVLSNIQHVQYVLAERPKFDIAQLQQVIQKYKVKGLSAEINNILLPFKFLKKIEEPQNANSTCSESDSEEN